MRSNDRIDDTEVQPHVTKIVPDIKIVPPYCALKSNTCNFNSGIVAPIMPVTVPCGTPDPT